MPRARARYRARHKENRLPPICARTALAAGPASSVGALPSPNCLTCRPVILAWLDALPDSLRDTATAEALQAIVDLDLEGLDAIELPRGYGRD
jgi:hypothetical protein